jgi:reactive intermediate/imine deaminase
MLSPEPHQKKDQCIVKNIVQTTDAPAAVGPYSQAVTVDRTVWLSGQIGLDPATGKLVEGFDAQVKRAFDNLTAVAKAAGGSLADVVKVNLFLTDLAQFKRVNEMMAQYFPEPRPARSTVQVSGLPLGAQFEAEAIMVLSR